MIKVSVVIATYNNGHLLKRAIQSILSQTFREFELIVVDDGSGDNTKEVVESIPDERIRYLHHQKNKGEAAARNTAIAEAKGEYIAFLDSDDEALPERLDVQLRVFESNEDTLGVVFSDMIRVDRSGSQRVLHAPSIMPSEGDMYEKALAFKVFKVGVGTSMFRKSCFNDVGLFDESLPYYVDLDLFIRLSKKYRFYHINKPLIKYYDVTEGATLTNMDKRIRACESILEKYYDDIKRNGRILSIYYHKIAILNLGIDVKKSKNFALKSLKEWPYSIKSWVVLMLSLCGKQISSTAASKFMK